MARHPNRIPHGLTDGARDVAPLLIAIIPFGLIVGVAAASSVLGPALGWATSFVIFAGAAQLATIQLFDAGTAAVVVVLTALVINSRHLMYSGGLAAHFSEFPRVSRYTLPYVLTDQAFAISIVRYADTDDVAYKRWYFAGTAFTLWTVWQISTLAGVVVGAQIPESWSLDFAIPLVFLALLIPVVRTRPMLAAAVVGGVVAVAAHDAPYGLGLIVGACAGIAAGVVLEKVAR